MREINPKDVPQLMRDGKLNFGQELEFSDRQDFSDSEICFFEFFDSNPIINQRQFGGKRVSDKSRFYFKYARFPLPDLRINDPVWIRDHIDSKWEKGIFRKWLTENKNGFTICVYNDGLCAWTATTGINWRYWRIPTESELEAAGLDPDWYKGRRGL